jgi:hypothetical protein
MSRKLRLSWPLCIIRCDAASRLAGLNGNEPLLAAWVFDSHPELEAGHHKPAGRPQSDEVDNSLPSLFPSYFPGRRMHLLRYRTILCRVIAAERKRAGFPQGLGSPR